jgi:hypothetical protein
MQRNRGPRLSRVVEDPTRELQKTLHELLDNKNYEAIQQIIEENKELVYKSTQKGLISLLLRYSIIMRNDDLIATLIPRLSMKRDYFSLILYNHPHQIATNIDLFGHINIYLLDSNDIKFIVENGLFYLLPLLDGKFVKVNIPKTIDNAPQLKFINLPNIQTYIDKLLIALCNDPKLVVDQRKKQKCQEDISKFVTCIESKQYDVIIDGGNVIHSRNGIPQPDDLIELERILISQGLKPLVVIYPKHLKDYSKLSQIRNICPSPYNDLDDYYILLAYLINLNKGTVTHIVTNDEYQDHILRLNDGKNDNSDFSGHIRDDAIRYSNMYGNINLITPLKTHSNCLQIIDNIAYIPTDDSGFVRVVM